MPSWPRPRSGYIQRLPSGAFRVSVYAGTDPVTGKQRRLRETCPDEAAATATLGRLLKQAQSHQAPDRDATFGLVLDKYLEVTDLAESTLATHESYIRRIIRPVLGGTKAREIGADTLDTLNAHLKRCSRICTGCPRIEHYVDGRPRLRDAADRCATTAPPGRTPATSVAHDISASRSNRPPG